MKINTLSEPSREPLTRIRAFPSLKENRSLHNKAVIKSTDLSILFNKKERAKREKDITKMSKESENYSIISSFLCHKSLEMIKKQSLMTRKKERREDRCRNPLVLFNIVNEKSRLATPTFPNAMVSSPAREYSAHIRV
jgi:hypothetical protein